MPPAEIHFLMTVAALVIAAITLLDRFYGKAANVQKEISEIRQELASVKTKVEPFWNMLEDNLPALLKRPTHITMDDLLTMYQTCRETMTLEQLENLQNELIKAKEEARQNNDPRMMGYLSMAAIVDSRIQERKRKAAGKEEKTHGKLRLS